MMIKATIPQFKKAVSTGFYCFVTRVMKCDGHEVQIKLLTMMTMRRVRMRVVFEMVILSP